MGIIVKYEKSENIYLFIKGAGEIIKEFLSNSDEN